MYLNTGREEFSMMSVIITRAAMRVMRSLQFSIIRSSSREQYWRRERPPSSTNFFMISLGLIFKDCSWSLWTMRSRLGRQPSLRNCLKHSILLQKHPMQLLVEHIIQCDERVAAQIFVWTALKNSRQRLIHPDQRGLVAGFAPLDVARQHVLIRAADCENTENLKWS